MVQRLAQGRAFGLDGEVDVHRRAAERRRAVAGEEVVRGDGAAEGHVEVRVHVNAAGDDVLAASRRSSCRPVKPLPMRRDLLVLDQHVGLVGVAGRDDRAALDQRAHRRLPSCAQTLH